MESIFNGSFEEKIEAQAIKVVLDYELGKYSIRAFFNHVFPSDALDRVKNMFEGGSMGYMSDHYVREVGTSYWLNFEDDPVLVVRHHHVKDLVKDLDSYPLLLFKRLSVNDIGKILKKALSRHKSENHGFFVGRLVRPGGIKFLVETTLNGAEGFTMLCNRLLAKTPQYRDKIGCVQGLLNMKAVQLSFEVLPGDLSESEINAFAYNLWS